jgi:hypothetical protein
MHGAPPKKDKTIVLCVPRKFLAIVNKFPLTPSQIVFTMRRRNQDGVPENVGGRFGFATINLN